MPGDPHKQLVTLTTFPVVAQVTGRASGKDAGAPVEFTPAVALVIRADDANAATILGAWGSRPTTLWQRVRRSQSTFHRDTTWTCRSSPSMGRRAIRST